MPSSRHTMPACAPRWSFAAACCESGAVVILHVKASPPLSGLIPTPPLERDDDADRFAPLLLGGRVRLGGGVRLGRGVRVRFRGRMRLRLSGSGRVRLGARVRLGRMLGLGRAEARQAAQHELPFLVLARHGHPDAGAPLEDRRLAFAVGHRAGQRAVGRCHSERATGVHRDRAGDGLSAVAAAEEGRRSENEEPHDSDVGTGNGRLDPSSEADCITSGGSVSVAAGDTGSRRT